MANDIRAESRLPDRRNRYAADGPGHRVGVDVLTSALMSRPVESLNRCRQTWLPIPLVKIGIMICDRNRTCTGNKCFKSIIERDGAFAKYRKDEPIEVVGWMTCGGCPGERLEAAPADMKKYGAEVIYLASCYLAGYPICPYIEDQKSYIEDIVGLPVKVGTHPMPANYIKSHAAVGDWQRDGAERWLSEIKGDQNDADRYDSTNPNFLKK